MITVDLTIKNNTFDTGVQTINDGSNFVQVALFRMHGSKDKEAQFKTAALQLFPTGAALTGLKITKSVTDNGDHIDWMADTDFNTATSDFPAIQPLNIYTLASGGKGFIRMGHVENLEEIAIWAKGTGNLRIIGNFI